MRSRELAQRAGRAVRFVGAEDPAEAGVATGVEAPGGGSAAADGGCIAVASRPACGDDAVGSGNGVAGTGRGSRGFAAVPFDDGVAPSGGGSAASRQDVELSGDIVSVRVFGWDRLLRGELAPEGAGRVYRLERASPLRGVGADGEQPPLPAPAFGAGSDLASHVLAQATGLVADDWEARHGDRPVLAYSYVGPEHSGTSYRAAGWEDAGVTSGRPPGQRGGGAGAPGVDEVAAGGLAGSTV